MLGRWSEADTKVQLITMPTTDTELERPDPRAQIAAADGAVRLTGVRCSGCGYPAAEPFPRCPVCRSAVETAVFDPVGVVWSSTVVRVPVPGRVPPYGLAYVDIDGGPRVLVHLDVADDAVPVGARVRIVRVNPTGDVEATVVST